MKVGDKIISPRTDELTTITNVEGWDYGEVRVTLADGTSFIASSEQFDYAIEDDFNW